MVISRTDWRLYIKCHSEAYVLTFVDRGHKSTCWRNPVYKCSLLSYERQCVVHQKYVEGRQG